ncbi:type IV pilus biogenesis/stability protein PilW [Thiomonas sp. FB-Cd]|uniref:type IV pilus biogenesis/stability protein PilW n=1 Tax=Thiomonas sp. FB-Cd TaxID=1158292 RepID=UPI001E353FE9|nr:type IV pilus biogenesis/stability protein PilW [Thiomonas sp. FB-Cd]
MLGLALALTVAGCATRPEANGASAQTPNSGNEQADKNAQIRLELAEGYYQRGQTEVALSEVGKALEQAPDYVPAYTMRALIEMSLGRNAQAEASFRKALAIQPNNADALHNYGWFLCTDKRYAESFAMFKRALAVPGYRYPQRTDLAYGVCQYRDGDIAGAERTLRAGFALDPANPALSTNLSLVLYRQNKLKDALFYIRRVNSGQYANAQSLWLGILIARAAADTLEATTWTNQLVQRFPDSREAIASQQGRFDDSSLLPR